MHVLIVIDHPDPQSFTHAACNRFADGAQDAGHTVELADLNAEGFDPRWSIADREQDDTGTSLPDIRKEQERIERCDALCIAFPLFWFGMPAMTKGWIDRVWTYGWAYDQIEEPDQSLLKSRTGVLLIPSGGQRSNWQRYGVDDAMEAIWRNGMLGYFGMSDPQIMFLNGSEGSDARRAGLLDEAYRAGYDLKAP